MTTRDRLMAIGSLALAVLVAVWFLVVSPEQKKASELSGQVSTAQQALSTVQAQAKAGTSAKSNFGEAYATIVRLGEAVPTQQEVPALLYELDQAAGAKHVEFASIVSGASAGSPVETAATVSAGFASVPFTFVFNGSFNDLNRLIAQLDGLTTRASSGHLLVGGRLLAIQSINLDPQAGATGKLTGTIHAAAYVLPASASLTAGATPAGPAGTSAQSASSTTTQTSPTVAGAPALIRIKP